MCPDDTCDFCLNQCCVLPIPHENIEMVFTCFEDILASKSKKHLHLDMSQLRAEKEMGKMVHLYVAYLFLVR